jgi:glutathione S-transferase
VNYRLINRRGSGGFVVESALAMAGVEVEIRDLGTAPGTPLPEDFRAINPWRQVPTLIMPDGSTMTECAAILIHLAACHPAARLSPAVGTPAHGQFLRWMVFTSVNVYEGILRAGNYASRFTTEAGCEASVREAATRRTGDALQVLDGAASPEGFMLGARMSVLDVYVAMLFLWFRGEVHAPRLTALTDGVRHDATVGPVWRHHFGER